MNEPTTDMQQEKLRSWHKSTLDAVMHKMVKSKAVNGTAVQGRPMWAVPFQILIAKVWATSEKSRFVWTISGAGAITDHIPGSTASTPRDAARHFSLKWQMDADRLLNLARRKPMVKGSEAHMQDYSAQLIKRAEDLYDLTTREEFWK